MRNLSQRSYSSKGYATVTPVQIELETDYPFDDILKFRVKTEQPVRFPLHLRIPSWAKAAEIKIEDGEPIKASPGTFQCIDEEWSGNTSITLRLPMQIAIQRRYNNSISVERGPLIYALKMEEDWKQIGGQPPHADWEIYPRSAWNYALQIDADHPENSIEFDSQPVGSCPFSPDGAPIQAKVKGKRIPEWKIEHNAAEAPPESPVSSSEPLEDLTLIPYGSTNLRVTEFPKLG